MRKKFGPTLLVAAAVALCPGEAFRPAVNTPRRYTPSAPRAEGWTGEVVADADGRIQGCTVTPLDDTTFTVRVDGAAADLGNFSTVVYRKITADAKRQSFQGFRPGTLPAHLLPAYRAFAMDEVAKEAALEALQQQDVRPFAGAREEMVVEQVSIPPPAPKRRKKKKGGRKKKGAAVATEDGDGGDAAPAAWATFATMKEALAAGWEVRRPAGPSFAAARLAPARSRSYRARGSRGRVSASSRRIARARRSTRWTPSVLPSFRSASVDTTPRGVMLRTVPCAREDALERGVTCTIVSRRTLFQRSQLVYFSGKQTMIC